MKVSDFDYELPPERIAQHPASPRDSARMLAHHIARDASEHLFVRDLERVLARGDLLIVNDTRVRSARVGGARAAARELLATRARRALARARAAAARLRPGETLGWKTVHFARMVERGSADEAARGCWS